MAYDKVVDSAVLDAGLTKIADAIRAKGDTSAELSFPDGMAEAVEAIDGGSDMDALISRSATEVRSNAGHIGDYAFYSNTALTTVDIPAAASIGDSAFYGCTGLTEVSFPAATYAAASAFYRCTGLTIASFPKATDIYAGVFQGCTALATVRFPNLTAIYASAFRECAKLTTVSFPKVTSISVYAFYGCTKLTEADFPLLGSAANYVFSGCKSLKALILRRKTLCTLSGTNALNNCCHILGTVDTSYNPNGDKDGYIYVPTDLLQAYQTASNWSTYSTQFRGLEDWTVDGTITGKLDWDKINAA